MIGQRDFDYIEARLLAPCTDALDAVERLREVGENELADALLSATQEFTDNCRKARRILTDKRRWEREARRA